MHYTLGYTSQPVVTDMSKKQTPKEVAAAVVQFKREKPTEPPSGLTRRERNVWRILTKPAPGLPGEVVAAFKEMFDAERPVQKQTEMSKKMTSREVGIAAAKLLEQDPVEPPEGLTRRGRRIWSVLATPDPYLQDDIDSAIMEVVNNLRPEKQKKCLQSETYDR